MWEVDGIHLTTHFWLLLFSNISAHLLHKNNWIVAVTSMNVLRSCWLAFLCVCFLNFVKNKVFFIRVSDIQGFYSYTMDLRQCYTSTELKALRPQTCMSCDRLVDSNSTLDLTCIPTEISRPYRHNKYCVLKRKRERKGGIRQRLKKRGHRVPLPSIMLGNVRSLKNKSDELAACVAYNQYYRNCCIIALTETWLDESVPDTCVNLNHFSLVRNDRSAEDSGKTKGGGVCMYINSMWCNTFVTKKALCTPDLEMLCIQCRPHYLPREICCVSLMCVCAFPLVAIRVKQRKI